MLSLVYKEGGIKAVNKVIMLNDLCINIDEKFKYKITTTASPDKILELGGKKVEVFYKDNYEIIEEEGSE